MNDLNVLDSMPAVMRSVEMDGLGISVQNAPYSPIANRMDNNL
jgi:hypothetical protein